jgi:hypothetical protein
VTRSYHWFDRLDATDGVARHRNLAAGEDWSPSVMTDIELLLSFMGLLVGFADLFRSTP